MKMTLDLIISNPAAFAMGKVDYALSLYQDMPPEDTPKDWIHVRKIEIDFGELDLGNARAEALRIIDEQIKEARDSFTATLSRMEEARAKLLALPAPLRGVQ